MGSSVTQGNKWSFPSAFCISPFITFLWPTFKVLSPSILFYSGVTFRCRDIYELCTRIRPKHFGGVGFHWRGVMVTYRYKGYFFHTIRLCLSLYNEIMPMLRAPLFLLNEVQWFFTANSPQDHLWNKLIHRNNKMHNTNYWFKGLEMFESYC